ncbi:MAG TPA: hypothetical protein VH643_33970 [Gemmataceae bacterium]|jgi:hypothetical protein
MSKFPISRVCPQCGGKEYSLRKPKTFVAFTADRVCKACLTRYSPPTPPWGGVMFLLAAPVLGLLGFVLIALLVGPFTLLGLACDGVLGLFVLAVFIGGIRILIASANQVELNGGQARRAGDSEKKENDGSPRAEKPPPSRSYL